MANIALELEEDAGYDGFTSAWVIRRDGTILVQVDLGHFGQDDYDRDFRSQEAEEIARACLDAIKKYQRRKEEMHGR